MRAFSLTICIPVRYPFNMKRISIFLGEQQIARLRKVANVRGVTMAELLRLFLEEGLRREERRRQVQPPKA